jgi:hypothetical protein
MRQVGKAAMAEAHGRLLWLLPLVAAAIGFGIGRRATVETAPRVAASHFEQTTAHRTRPTRPAPVTPRSASALPPMPAADVPIAESFEALAARARAGDANAALRLLRELGHCVAQPGTPDVSDDSPNDLQYLQAQITRGELAGAQAACPNVTPDELATVGEWLQRAADSGDPGAALCYVMLATWDRYLPDRYSDAWVESMQRYRATARTYAERALAAGYAQASWFLYDSASGIYSTNLFPIDRDIDPDFERAYALALFRGAMSAAREDASDPNEARSWQMRAAALRLQLSDAAIARAERWASAELAALPADGAPSPPCDLPFQ